MQHLAAVVERRGEPRWQARERPGWVARLRPGCPVSLINWSPRGALIEAGARLSPGTRVALQLTGPHESYTVKGRIQRAYVAGLSGRLGVQYRAAVMFDEVLLFRSSGAVQE